MRPNRLQWVIIWAAVLTAAHVLLDLRVSDLTCCGIGTYLHQAERFHRQQFAFTIIIVGALLAWQAAGWHWRCPQALSWLREHRAFLLGIIISTILVGVFVVAGIMMVAERFR